MVKFTFSDRNRTVRCLTVMEEINTIFNEDLFHMSFTDSFSLLWSKYPKLKYKNKDYILRETSFNDSKPFIVVKYYRI